MQDLIKTTNNNNNLRSKIYTIRGVPVMLDSDLAEIYGYSTKNFNRQVKNNQEKFEDADFMFKLTREEAREILRCKNFTLDDGDEQHFRYLPYAFTESGIYMLMTVLKGDLATRQSKALIRTFRAMKNYILENQNNLAYRENLQIIAKITDNSEDIVEIKHELKKIDTNFKKMSGEMEKVVKKSEISPILLDFTNIAETHEFLLLDGEPARAREAFIDIYSKAKQKIYIVDNYIDIRSLRLLQRVKPGIEIIFFTDNLKNLLHKSDYEAFKTERPDLDIKFIRTNGKIHDRFIILDDKIVYSSGASTKDAGSKITAISRVDSVELSESIRRIVEKILKNERLRLK